MAYKTARPDVPAGQVQISGPDASGCVLVEIGRPKYCKRFELQNAAEQIAVIEKLFATFPPSVQAALIEKLTSGVRAFIEPHPSADELTALAKSEGWTAASNAPDWSAS